MAYNGSSRTNVHPPLINPAQLAVAATRFPKILPQNLKPYHIAAILLDTGHFTPSFPKTNINSRTIAEHTRKLMRRALAFGKYYTSLTLELRAETNNADHFRALGWSVSEKITQEMFDECVSIWHFIRHLEISGDGAQKWILEYGFKAYGRVKESVLKDLGLLNGVVDQGAK